MKLIVGLGNPGSKYENTRHNIGFMVVDELLRRLTCVSKTKWQESKKFNSQLYILNSKLVLAKPQTMMNASGYAVEKILRYYDIKKLSDLWIIHDDLDLPLGKIKIRVGGGTAGHHGIESIIEELGTADFVRFRIGIGHPKKAGKWEVGEGRLVSENAMHREVEDYVLKEFYGKEANEAAKAIKKAARIIESALEKGTEKAMNQFNSK